MINLPIVAPMSRKVTLSRSIRTLGTMVASGVDCRSHPADG
jgi:type II secretory pathway component PulF